MAQAATGQLNARIDVDLKERGNRSLLRAGYSPARAIRALWTIAADNDGNPEAIERLLGNEAHTEAQPLAQAQRTDDKAERIDALHRGWTIISEMAKGSALGQSTNDSAVSAPSSPVSYEELCEIAAFEKLSKFNGDASAEATEE